MSHHSIRLIAPVAALIVLASAQSAGARSAHPYKSQIMSNSISTAGGYPAVGGSTLLAGPITSAALGSGALVDRLTITGHPKPDVFTFKGTEIAYLADGTFRDAFTGYSILMEDGSQSVVVSGHITGATG